MKEVDVRKMTSAALRNHRQGCTDRLRLEAQRTCDGADHQRDHDLRDACGAFLHDHDRQRRGRGACGYWRTGKAFSAMIEDDGQRHLLCIQSSPCQSIAKRRREQQQKAARTIFAIGRTAERERGRHTLRNAEVEGVYDAGCHYPRL